MSRFDRSESGAALVEFAVVAPVLALLLLGIVDFGRYMYDGILAANAARAAAAYGAQTLSTAEDTGGMQAAAIADSQGVTWNPSGISATAVCLVSNVSVPCGSNTAETVYVQVSVTGTFTPLIKYPLLPNPVTVSGSSFMRVEQQ
jgi:Flp pilus assembly protein TadG